MLVRLLLVAIYTLGGVGFAVYLHLYGLFDELTQSGWTTSDAELTYEYIVVGAGTAGLTIASGLLNHTLLLLESGPSTPNALLDTPLLTPLLQHHSATFDWSHYTVQQRRHRTAGALNDRRSRWPTGRGHGGSQILNYMMWTRGHPEDYRGWFGAEEDYDYSRDVLPYFEAAERAYGGKGPERLPHQTPLAAAVLEASRQFGFAEQAFRIPLVTQRSGRRHTNAHESRQRGQIAGHRHLMGAHVKRLLFNEDEAEGLQLRVIGVEFERSGQTFQVHASRGVVLSAGALGSPALLQASGLGPAEWLREQQIPIRLALSGIGRNLQDHVTTGVDLVLLNQTMGIRPWELLTPTTLWKYLMKGQGPLTMCGCEALGFVSTTANSTDSDHRQPDLGFMVLPVGPSADGGAHLRHLLNLAPAVWQRYFEPLVGSQQTASILPIVLHPRSRGTVRWNRSAEAIEIDPAYFAEPADAELLVRGLRILEQMLEQPALRRLGAELNPQLFPGCEGRGAFASVEYWRCYVRELTLTAFHPVGTCRMGEREEGEQDEESAVVERDYAVHGVRGLWVVDASVMPSMPSGNPNAVVAMLAERFVEQQLK